MTDAYDLNHDPDPQKCELASVQLVDELFRLGLLDRLARLEGCEAWLREVRARQNDTPRTVAQGHLGRAKLEGPPRRGTLHRGSWNQGLTVGVV